MPGQFMFFVKKFTTAYCGLFLCSVASAASNPVNSQVEFRLALNESGYNKLASSLSMEPSPKRDDLYLEFLETPRETEEERPESGPIQEGDSYVLHRRTPPEKLRITNKAGKLEWQHSRKVNSSVVNSNGIKIQISQTDKIEIKGTKYPDLARLFTSGSDCFAALLQSTEPLPDLHDRIVTLSQEIRNSALLMQSIQNLPQGLLVPASFSRKERKEKTVSIDGVELNVQLGASTKIDENGNEQLVYEIEAERDGALVASDSRVALAFLNKLIELGLVAEDSNTGSIDSLAFSFAKYKEMGF